MINKIEIKDFDRLNELGLIVNKNFVNVYDLNKLLESEYDFIYGYYINNILVGFIHINKLYENMDIVNIVVDPDYRRKGIASSLLNYVISLFSDVSSIILEVNENNHSAIKLYEKQQFNVINKRLNYYGSDSALIMKRDV